MDNLVRIGLILFIIYLPFFVFLLGYLALKRYPGFSFQTHWISNLGEKHTKSQPIFSYAIALLSLLGIFFTIQMNSVLPHDFVGYLTLGLLVISLFALLLVVAFPMNIHLLLHFIVSALFYFNLVAFNLGTAYLILTDLLIFPKIFVFLNILLMLVEIIFFLSIISIFRKYQPTQAITLVSIRKNESSAFIRNATILEWSVICLQLAWLFLAGLSLLR